MDRDIGDSGVEDDMTQDELEAALESFTAEADDEEMSSLLQSMNENQLISWEEAERALSDGSKKTIKSGLPELVRPTEPDNSTDVDECIRRLSENDASLTEVNINNMKRVPIVQIQKLIRGAANNRHLKKLSMSNTGLTDSALEPLPQMLETNTSLLSLNLETNFLSGDFLAKMFRALITNQTVEEVRAANQGVSCSHAAEMEICEQIFENETLRKVGLTFRYNEARNKVDQALFRNNEIRRIMRRDDQRYQQAHHAQADVADDD